MGFLRLCYGVRTIQPSDHSQAVRPVIDIGSNSIKILVAARDTAGALQSLKYRTIDVRISAESGPGLVLGNIVSDLVNLFNDLPEFFQEGLLTERDSHGNFQFSQIHTERVERAFAIPIGLAADRDTRADSTTTCTVVTEGVMVLKSSSKSGSVQAFMCGNSCVR